MIKNDGITIDATVVPPTHPPYPPPNMVNPPLPLVIPPGAVNWTMGARPFAANMFDLDQINYTAPLPAQMQVQQPVFGMHKFSNMYYPIGMYKFQNPIHMTRRCRQHYSTPSSQRGGGGFSLGAIIEIPRFSAGEDKDRNWTPVIRITPPFYGFRQH